MISEFFTIKFFEYTTYRTVIFSAAQSLIKFRFSLKLLQQFPIPQSKAFYFMIFKQMLVEVY